MSIDIMESESKMKLKWEKLQDGQFVALYCGVQVDIELHIIRDNPYTLLVTACGYAHGRPGNMLLAALSGKIPYLKRRAQVIVDAMEGEE